MKTLKVYTNKGFEKYINYNLLKRKFEGRFDTLDLDDITTTIAVPTESEIDTSVRELDLVDNISLKAKVAPEITDSGVRWLDLDDGNKYISNDKVDDKIRELDFDDKGNQVTNKKSKIGAIGALDFDDDIDTSDIAASIDDVYFALASDDINIVKSTIKKYASDITDVQRIQEAQLTQAKSLNYDCLKVLCGFMSVALTQKEKALDYIDKAEIKSALLLFKNCASKLTGENNTYGLIPNVIVECEYTNQKNDLNIIDFLYTKLHLPVFPIYARGAIRRYCYDIAEYIIERLSEKSLTVELSLNDGRFIELLKKRNDIPSTLFDKILDSVVTDRTNVYLVANLLIACIQNSYTTGAFQKIDEIIGFDSGRGNLLTSLIKYKNDISYQALNKYLKSK